MGQRTLPDRIADLFIARIYIGELRPGDRLPAERVLAEELGVDRTSLRMALRTLTRMSLVEPVQGSGITILNYRKHAGLDFLANVFRIPELELGSELLLSSLDLFVFSMPAIVRIALTALTKDRYEEALADLQEMSDRLALGSSVEKLSVLELKLQDDTLRVLANPITDLTANSSKALRQRLMVQFFNSIDVAQHIQYQREMLTAVAQGRTKPEQAEVQYRDYLVKVTGPLRKSLKALPLEPRLRESPLES